MGTSQVPRCTFVAGLDRLATTAGPGCYSWLRRSWPSPCSTASRMTNLPSVEAPFAAYRVGHAPPGSFSSDLISSPVPRQACVDGGGWESICVLTQIQLLWKRPSRPTESRNTQEAAWRSTALWFMFQSGMSGSTALLLKHHSFQGGLFRSCGPQDCSDRDRFLHNGRCPVEPACRDIRKKPGSR